MGYVCSEPQLDASADTTARKTLQAFTQESAKPRPSSTALKHGPSATAWRRAHERMKENETLWLSLLFDGIQHDGVGGLRENRRCPCCGSTLSRRTTALDAVGIVANLSEVHSRSLEAIVNAGEAAQRVESSTGGPRGGT